MNLYRVIISYLILFCAVVHSRSSSLDLAKRASDELSFVPTEEWCSTVVQGLKTILVSPALQLTKQQLDLIPTFSPRRFSRRQRLSLCPDESRQWLQSLDSLSATLTDDQVRTLQNQMHRLVQQLSEKHR